MVVNCWKCETPNKDRAQYCAACNWPMKEDVPPKPKTAALPASIQRQVFLGVFWGVFLSSIALGVIGTAAWTFMLFTVLEATNP